MLQNFVFPLPVLLLVCLTILYLHHFLFQNRLPLALHQVLNLLVRELIYFIVIGVRILSFVIIVNFYFISYFFIPILIAQSLHSPPHFIWIRYFLLILAFFISFKVKEDLELHRCWIHYFLVFHFRLFKVILYSFLILYFWVCFPS